MLAVRKTFSETMDKWSFTADYKIIPTSSKKAVSRFDKIDFLHIDGNFSEAGSLEDVLYYLPKVIPGGYILLSNLFVTVDGEYSKMKALWALMDQCETIAEIENSNAALFQKIQEPEWLCSFSGKVSGIFASMLKFLDSGSRLLNSSGNRCLLHDYNTKKLGNCRHRPLLYLY